ncbi:TIGR02234 family membrane protein [Nonomuraea sp. NPDC046802]|uniref:TIGR02234 family membrane protein n=1 Tax=Nonomuraea sp. NPDC046802 TaxID=3154919 RepID=UPI0033E0F3C2
MTALGALLVLLAAGRVWVRALGAAGSDTVVPTGGELSPALTPVALAGLAGVVAVLATKGVGRRVVGGLLALCGIGAAAGTWTALDEATVADWLHERNVLRGATAMPWEAVSLWPGVAAVGALLMIAGGVLAIVRGGRWTGMSARYERGAGADTPEARAAQAAQADRAMWDALDRGDDPTDPR